MYEARDKETDTKVNADTLDSASMAKYLATQGLGIEEDIEETMYDTGIYQNGAYSGKHIRPQSPSI